MTLSNLYADMQQPLAFGSLQNWIKLLIQNRGVHAEFSRRAAIALLTSLLTAPVRFYEQFRYEALIRKAEITASPVFILGHWRSGTTFLHYLMSQDTNFGTVSTFQTIAPELAISGEKFIKPLLARVAPTTRSMDNLPLSLDGPQEEEIALAAMSPYSFYHLWTFPRNARLYFERYALFEGIPKQHLQHWRHLYLHVLRKATLLAGGRRLLIKNPTNTGRIRQVLALFPAAKFIHIVRNPYDVFLSTRHLYQTVLSTSRLQRISNREIETNILLFYRRIMQKYLRERNSIPPENLVEVRYEKTVTAALPGLERIYNALDLPDFTRQQPKFRTYLTSQAGYRKNAFRLAAETIRLINSHWGFAFEAWDYPQR